jgi:hypothetical protein
MNVYKRSRIPRAARIHSDEGRIVRERSVVGEEHDDGGRDKHHECRRDRDDDARSHRRSFACFGASPTETPVIAHLDRLAVMAPSHAFAGSGFGAIDAPPFAQG